jgi:endonuclease YncB( thermonuclease family)
LLREINTHIQSIREIRSIDWDTTKYRSGREQHSGRGLSHLSTGSQCDDKGRAESRLVTSEDRLEIPRIGDSEDAYGRTLAYVYLDPDKNGSYEHSFNEDLIVLGLARTTTFSHTYRRHFERLREEAEERGMGLWSACPDVTSY